MRRLLCILSILTLPLTACTTEEPASRIRASASPGDTANAGDTGSATGEPRRMLRPFDSCDALLSFYQRNAADLVGPYGLGGGFYDVLETDAVAADDSAGGREVAQAPAAAPAVDGGVSGTNVQEAGVDEPDLVKTDGEVIITTVTGAVQIVDVTSEQVVATVPLPGDSFGGELLLDGDTLLVLSNTSVPFPGGPADLVPAYQPTRTVITRVDISNPADPVVLGAVRMEGGYRSARMIDGTVRMVMVSEPTGLAFTQPTDGGLTAEQEAEDRNRQILRESTIDDWVPHLQVLDADGDAGATRPILACTDINEPAEFAGLSTLSVLTFDLRAEGLEPTSGAGLVAAGDTVYASTDRLIVATSPWGGWIIPFIDVIGRPDPGELATDLHSFDISDPASTRYVASGSVRGTLINQFALSEIDGVIRVATTTEPDWFGRGTGEGADASASSLVVLAEEGEALVETGRIDGLGVTERIYAVRYLGPDVAAIVTFRQTDPLYLIDTADPTAPRLLGELSIPGFSSYLHPVAPGYLLGVGQDADPETGRQLGLQASLFDIRDLADPQRIAQVDFGEGYSPVEYDHRAFLHWTATGQAVIPAELYGPVALPGQGASEGEEFIEPYGSTFAGAVVLDVGEGTLAESGRLSHRDLAPGEYAPGVMRSMVIGDGLWTLTHESLARHGLGDLARQTVIPLG
ncbi:MAG TPA: beta-propeller domain-containing protein [Euzebya sp.]|nr:beta-propeller domain-containing protein [Euzebya sp.]